MAPVSVLLISLLLTVSPFAVAGQAEMQTSLWDSLKTALQQELVAGEAVGASACLQDFYRQRDLQPAWSGENRQDLLDGLIRAIGQVEKHGLNPADYHQAALGQAMADDDPVNVELLATDAYLSLASHLQGGRVDPVTIEPGWTSRRRDCNLAGHLEQALAQRRIAESLDDLQPAARDYRILMQALARYREAGRMGDWEPMPPGQSLRLGDVGPRIPILRRRLQAIQLLSEGALTSDVFDLDLERAVVSYQRQVGIEDDGVVGPVSLRELNKGPAERIRQIRANLERWRWLPQDLGRRHIRVNIADFRLEAWRDQRVERRHDVIVGRTYRKTPVFSDAISFLVFNPLWDVPRKLARLDLLPAFQKDPDKVTRLGYQVTDQTGRKIDPATIQWQDYSRHHFPFRLRQLPGPHNALGRVKMMFPNKYDIYLHDTPAVELFSKQQRTFSSGCVRVAQALELAKWLLAETPAWPWNRIERLLDSGGESRVDLAFAVPIHILYFTAVVEDDGSLRLINDVYGRDARIITALDSPHSGGDP